MAEIDRLFHRMQELEASDLHLKSGKAPRFRVHGALIEDPDGLPEVPAEILDEILREILSEEQERHYTDHKGIDFAGRKGSDVISVAAGVVTRVGSQSGYGEMVEIHHLLEI